MRGESLNLQTPASVNGVPLATPEEVLTADELRSRASVELLRQAAIDVGLLDADDPAPVGGAISEAAAAAIESLLDQAVVRPEADEATCQRFHAANAARFAVGERVHLRHVLFAVTPGVDIDILRKRAAGIESFVLEDESRLVGRCSLPLPLHQGMQEYPLVWLEDSLDGRVQRILRDYVIDLCAEFVDLHGAETGFALFSERLLESLANIRKRLGGEREESHPQAGDGAM